MDIGPHVRPDIVGGITDPGMPADASVDAIQPGDAVLTHVASHLEPVRGFHVPMRCLPEVMRRRPNVIVVGGDHRAPDAGGPSVPARLDNH